MNISDALHFIKNRATDSLPATLIRRSCRRVGHNWRERKLGPVTTTHLFLQQVLHGNTAISHLRRLARHDATDSAFCQARGRLPLAVLEDLVQSVLHKLRVEADSEREKTWFGHRTFFLDGTGFSMPDTEELRDHFGQHGLQAEGCGFPTAHLLCLFDARHGYLLRTVASPLRTHDVAKAAVTHEALCPGDVVIGDRNFASYAHIALCLERGIHGVFRMHQARKVSFVPHRAYRRTGEKSPKGKSKKDMPTSRWIKRLGKHDQVVEYYKPKTRPAWMTKEEYDKLPESIKVREIRYRVREPGRRSRVVTLTTTLLNSKRYPAEAVAKLYGLRWRVETNLRHLKITMKMDVLRCESVDGVLKELAVFTLVYNLVCRVMLEASRQQNVPMERISFIDTWRWLQQAVLGEQLPRIIVNPYRPDRFEPRKVKRRQKKFPYLKQPRNELKKLLRRNRIAA